MTYGLELMMALFEIVQGIISTIMKASGLGNNNELILPDEMVVVSAECCFYEIMLRISKTLWLRILRK